MKKIYCLIVLLAAAMCNAKAQFYVRAGLGFAMPQAGQTMDGTGQGYNGSQTYTTYTQVYNVKPTSFSTGVHGVLGVGYMFSDHVGVQLDGDAGLSTKKYTFSIDNVSVGGVPSNVDIVQRAKGPFVVIPSLVLQTGGEKINLYTRVGVALPLSTKIVQDQILTNLPGNGAVEVDDFTLNIKNSFSLGFSAAAGVQYKLSEKLSLWGEISMLSMSVYIKEADLTAVTANGQSVALSQVSGAQVVKYSKNAIVDSNGAQQPTYSQPFSNVGIQVGIKFTLGEKRQHVSRRDNEDIDDTKKPFRRR